MHHRSKDTLSLLWRANFSAELKVWEVVLCLGLNPLKQLAIIISASLSCKLQPHSPNQGSLAFSSAHNKVSLPCVLLGDSICLPDALRTQWCVVTKMNLCWNGQVPPEISAKTWHPVNLGSVSLALNYPSQDQVRLGSNKSYLDLLCVWNFEHDHENGWSLARPTAICLNWAFMAGIRSGWPLRMPTLVV